MIRRWATQLIVAVALLAGIWVNSIALAQDDSSGGVSLWFTLGTQAGPIANGDRSQPANLLIADGQYIVVDAGDGVAEQLAKIGVSLQSIDTVLLSHLHFDHTGGLSALIGLRYQLGFADKLTIIGPPGTNLLVQGLVQSLDPLSHIGSGLPGERRDPAQSVTSREVGTGDDFKIGVIEMKAVENTHYTLDEDHLPSKEPLSLSFRFKTSDRVIVYTGDTGPSPAVERLAKGADLLVSEMLDLESQIARVESDLADQSPTRITEIVGHLKRHHLLPEDVGRLAHRASVKSVVITHQGPGFEDAAHILSYKSQIARHFQGQILIARDLDSF